MSYMPMKIFLSKKCHFQYITFSYLPILQFGLHLFFILMLRLIFLFHALKGRKKKKAAATCYFCLKNHHDTNKVDWKTKFHKKTCKIIFVTYTTIAATNQTTFSLRDSRFYVHCIFWYQDGYQPELFCSHDIFNFVLT